MVLVVAESNQGTNEVVVWIFPVWLVLIVVFNESVVFKFSSVRLGDSFNVHSWVFLGNSECPQFAEVNDGEGNGDQDEDDQYCVTGSDPSLSLSEVSVFPNDVSGFGGLSEVQIF